MIPGDSNVATTPSEATFEVASDLTLVSCLQENCYMDELQR